MGERAMRALTLWQPWATCIAHYGKDVENRTWPCPPGLVGQPIAIHAGKRLDRDAFEWLIDEHMLPPANASDLPLGAIVAIARIGSVIPPGRGGSRWKQLECYGWQLGDVEALPEPIPCRGHQGLWFLPDDVHDQVVRALERDVA